MKLQVKFQVDLFVNLQVRLWADLKKGIFEKDALKVLRAETD